MPKYLIKTTVVYHYELESSNQQEALSEGMSADNLDKFYWVRDVVNSEATELDESWQGLHTIEEAEWQGE
jgi:hypothetical protein